MVGADPKSVPWGIGCYAALFIAFPDKVCPVGNVATVREKGRPSFHHDRTFKSLQCSFRPSCGQTGREPLWSVLHP